MSFQNNYKQNHWQTNIVSFLQKFKKVYGSHGKLRFDSKHILILKKEEVGIKKV